MLRLARFRSRSSKATIHHPSGEFVLDLGGASQSKTGLALHPRNVAEAGSGQATRKKYAGMGKPISSSHGPLHGPPVGFRLQTAAETNETSSRFGHRIHNRAPVCAYLLTV
jgi:hypothetical protein